MKENYLTWKREDSWRREALFLRVKKRVHAEAAIGEIIKTRIPVLTVEEGGK